MAEDWSQRFRNNLKRAGDDLDKKVLSDPRAQKAVEEGTKYAHILGDQAKGYFGQVTRALDERMHSMPGYTAEAGKNGKKAVIATAVALGVGLTPIGWFIPLSGYVALAIGGYAAKKGVDAARSLDNSPQAKYRSREAQRYQK